MRRPDRQDGCRLFLATTGAVLLGATMLVEVPLRPPLLGWVGFVVVCAIAQDWRRLLRSSLRACG